MIKNPRGKTRSFEENKMLLLALNAALKRRMGAVVDKRYVKWSAIDNEVAADFGYCLQHVMDIRKEFCSM